MTFNLFVIAALWFCLGCAIKLITIGLHGTGVARKLVDVMGTVILLLSLLSALAGGAIYLRKALLGSNHQLIVNHPTVRET